MRAIYKRRIHLERSEAIILCVLIVLIAGMNFVLGFMYGMKRSSVTVVTTGGHKGHAGETHRSPASVADGKAVEATEDSEEIESKSEMMKAYEGAKKADLEETLLKQQYRLEPKSLSDLKADMFARSLNDRGPAQANSEVLAENSSAEDKLPESTPETSVEAPDALSATEIHMKDQAVRSPSSVGSLFEGSDDARKSFIPTPDHWTIQVGSYPTRDQAEAKLDLLLNNEVKESYIREKIVKGHSWYSVYVGSHSNKQWSERLAKRLVDRKLIDDFKVGRVP